MQTLVANPELTTTQLTKLLYGSNSTSSRTALRQLRGRVQDKLLNHLFFLDHSDARLLVSRRYEIECLDLLHKVTILYLEGEYVLTEKLLRRCIRLALQSDFTNYAEQAVRRLLTLYSEQHKRLLYVAASKQLAELRQKLADEQEVEQILSEVNSSLARTVATRRAVLPKIPAFIEKIEVLHKQSHTFATFSALYRLRLAYAELVGDYAGIIEYTALANKMLEQGKINERRFDRRFNQFMSVYAHLRGRQPAKGLKLAAEFAQDMHPTSSNWFFFYEHYILLALHAGEYEQAFRLLHIVQKNPSFTKQRPAAVERWELLEAYTEFVQPQDELPPRRRNQLAILAALTVPEHSRDKRGHNVAILVFQLLHYLRQQQLEPVLTRLERLRKYQQRHLRDAPTLRSRTFLRLLLLMPEADFNLGMLATKSKTLLAALRQAPLVGEADAETEIIPYEALWELTLAILRQGAPK